MSVESIAVGLAEELDYPVDLIEAYLAAGIPAGQVIALIDLWYEENPGDVDLVVEAWVEPRPTVAQLKQFQKQMRAEAN